jgi:hypothetical protein
MKDKNFPPDIMDSSLEELTDKANQIINSLESEKNLNNSIVKYHQLLKLNNIIEKKFHIKLKSISEETNKKVKKIKKRNENKT